FLQELSNHALRLVVLTLAEVVIANPPLAVDEVMRRPVFIIERLPNRVVAVDGNGVCDLQITNCLFDVAAFLLEGELRRMYADDYQARILIFRCPAFYIRQCSQTIDAGVSPKIDQDNFSLQSFAAERR